MKNRFKKLSWLFVVLCLLLLIAFTLSWDNPVSKKVSEVTGKALESVTSTAQSVVTFLVGALFLTAMVAVAPVSAVVAVVFAVVGLVCLAISAWSWFGSGSAKPDPVKLNNNG